MSVADLLRNSPKGRLEYHGVWDSAKLKDEMEKLSPPPLSRFHEEKTTNFSFGSQPSQNECMFGRDISDDMAYSENNNSRVNLLLDCPRESTIAFDRNTNYIVSDDEDGEEKHDSGNEDILDISAPLPSTSQNVDHDDSVQHPASCPVSPEWDLNTRAILDRGKKFSLLAQLSCEQRRLSFERHNREMNQYTRLKEAEIHAEIERSNDKRQRMIDRKQKQGLEETSKQLQRLREDHREHQKKIDTKQREIERKREILEEEERRRQKREVEKKEALHSLLKQIDGNRLACNNLIDTFQDKASLPDKVEQIRGILERNCSVLALQIQTAEQSTCIPEELVTKFSEHRDKSQQALELLKKQIEETNVNIKASEAKKQEELKKQAEDKQKQIDATKQLADAQQDFRVQAFKYILQEQSLKAKKLSDVEASIKAFSENAQMKKYRFDLQKAINTTINAISAVTGSHLLDKLQKLQKLLSGQVIEVSGKRVSVKDAPEALLFSQNLVAKMLVRKGEEQVTSKHETAFGIAGVVVGLWSSFPIVGELFMAHLQALCPYILPFYTTRQDVQSNNDYYKSVGYRINDDGSIEEQDKFLRRMSGLMRLYCACMVITPPSMQAGHHPHGVEQSWMWLARTMNLDPHPDITAAMIFDVLSVTGHFLLQQYKDQFVKLLYVLTKNYLPTLKSISVTSGTVGRLELFLSSFLKNPQIPAPEGYFTPRFWSTH
ncbi:unnamed protein product [Lymnaea stagnalis]|uniref:mRNA export factor GLE1 n=1 Tax=Lymnaea stagnalis TaxID=6523 RepID=A0AAV2I894_LYMST